MTPTGSSSLQATPLPGQYHLPTRARDSGFSSASFHSLQGGVIEPLDQDTGKGKQREGSEDKGTSIFDLEFEREVWRDHGLFEVTETKEMGIRESFEEEQGSKSTVEERETLVDAITQLTVTLEQMGQRVGNTPPAPPAAADAQKRQTLRHRIMSTFKEKKDQLKPKSPTSPPTHDCVICREPIQDKELRVPCGHYYDIECILSLFQASAKDEALFPPRCCKLPIPLNKVQKDFPPSLLKEFVEKSREFTTVKRVYCAYPRCSRFLGRQEEGATRSFARTKAYTCVCGMVTCSKCKMAHEKNVKHSCIMDSGADVVLALGKEKGWSRCPGCRTMIELNMGCFHMTCVCKAEFCYLCQARWKTCQCQQWDHTRLVTAAEERIDLELELIEALHRPAPVLARWNHLNVVRPVRPLRPNRERLVQAAVDELRVNHDCQHLTWRYRDGGGRCVGCYDVLDRYVFHCAVCHTIACNRCRLNRF